MAAREPPLGLATKPQPSPPSDPAMAAVSDAAESPDAAADAKRGSRACDGCRTRKRKCDGILPYCTNCTKSITRDSAGNPICTYYAEAKKRGPRPGYKDKMLLRLERLESILKPLVATDQVDPASTSPSSSTGTHTASNVPCAGDSNGMDASADLDVAMSTVASVTASASDMSSSSPHSTPPSSETLQKIPQRHQQSGLGRTSRKRRAEQRVMDLLEAVETSAVMRASSKAAAAAMATKTLDAPRSHASTSNVSDSASSSATPGVTLNSISQQLNFQHHPHQDIQHHQHGLASQNKMQTLAVAEKDASILPTNDSLTLDAALALSKPNNQDIQGLMTIGGINRSVTSTHIANNNTTTTTNNTDPRRFSIPQQVLQWTHPQQHPVSTSSMSSASSLMSHASLQQTVSQGQKPLHHQQQLQQQQHQQLMMPPVTHQNAHFSATLDVPPPDQDFSFLFGNSTGLFPASFHPSIVDPFPSIFPIQFLTPPILNNIALFDHNAVQRNAQRDLETHLVSLGLVYNLAIPLSTRQAVNVLSMKQQESIVLPRPLSETLAAMGVFFSTHPEMMVLSAVEGAYATTSPLKPIGVSDVARSRIARMYIMRARKTLNALVQPPGTTHLNTPDTSIASAIKDNTDTLIGSLDDCDAVRIMLILATICYGLGDGGDSMQLVADAYRLAQKSSIYESSLPPSDVTQHPPLTIDALVVSVPRMVGSKPPPVTLTPIEKFDRRLLWGSCIILDTYCAMASGYQFGIDEGDHPHLLNGYSFSDLLDLVGSSGHPSAFHASGCGPQMDGSASAGASASMPRPARLATATLGKHTLWENSPLAIMFDDVAAMSHASIAASTAVGASTGDMSIAATIEMYEAQIRVAILMRRILRFVRTRDSAHASVPSTSTAATSTPISSAMPTFGIPHGANLHTSPVNDAQTVELHDALLSWYDSVPTRFSAFPQLEVFARGTHPSSLEQYREWAYNLYAIEGILTFLSGFAYLHLPLLCRGGGDRRLYRLRPRSRAQPASVSVMSNGGIGGSTPTTRMDMPSSSSNADTSTKDTSPLWSSRQVLLACFRALTYMIQRLYTPTTPDQSPFMRAVYDTESVSMCQQQTLSVDTPSPALCWTVHALNMYIVSSAGLMAARGGRHGSCGEGTGTMYASTSGVNDVLTPQLHPTMATATPSGASATPPTQHDVQYDAVMRLVKTLVLPALERIGKIWPMAQLYQFKLATLLKGGTAEEWALEARLYA